MSGYIGTGLSNKKLLKGWLNSLIEEAVDYVVTKDTSFSIDPIKDYYELIDDVYVKTDDFYFDETLNPPAWHTEMDQTKVYYEKHICYYKTIRKRIKKAWVGTENGNKLVIDSFDLLGGKNPSKLPINLLSDYAFIKNDLILQSEYNFDISNYKTNGGHIYFSSSPSDNKIYYIRVLYGSEGAYQVTYMCNGTYDVETGEWTEGSLYKPDSSGFDISRIRGVFGHGNQFYFIIYNTSTSYYDIYNKFGGLFKSNWKSYSSLNITWATPGCDLSYYGYVYGGGYYYAINSDFSLASTSSNTGEVKRASYNYYGNNCITFHNFEFTPRYANANDLICEYEMLFDSEKIGIQIYWKSYSEWKDYTLCQLDTNGILVNELIRPYPYKTGGASDPVGSDGFILTVGRKVATKLLTVVMPNHHEGSISFDMYNYIIIVPERAMYYMNYDVENDKYVLSMIGFESDKIYSLPYNFKKGSLATYDNKIFLIGGEGSKEPYYMKYYDQVLKKWSNSIELPYDFYQGCAVVYENEIHILGGSYNPNLSSSSSGNNRKHYSWNGTSWRNRLDMTMDFVDGCAVVYDGSIYAFCGTVGKYWSLSNTTWQLVGGGGAPINSTGSSAVVYNNKIHILGGTNNQRYHYSWDGTQWVSESELPIGFQNGDAVVYNDKIHILYGTVNYSWDGISWVMEDDLPYSFVRGRAFFDKYLYLFGGRGESLTGYVVNVDHLFS